MKSNNGFALVEVLISVALLSTVCLLMAKTLTESIRSVYISHEHYEALLGMETVLWEMDHSYGEYSGNEDDPVKSLKNFRLNFNEQTVWKGNLRQVAVSIMWNPTPSQKEETRLSGYYAKK